MRTIYGCTKANTLNERPSPPHHPKVACRARPAQRVLFGAKHTDKPVLAKRLVCFRVAEVALEEVRPRILTNAPTQRLLNQQKTENWALRRCYQRHTWHQRTMSLDRALIPCVATLLKFPLLL